MARDSAMGSRDEKHLYSFRVDPRCLIIFRNSYDKLKHAQVWVCDIFSFKMFMNIKEISIWFRKFLTVLHFKLTLMGTIEFLFYFIKWLKALGFSLQASLWACILFVSMYLGYLDLNPKSNKQSYFKSYNFFEFWAHPNGHSIPSWLSSSFTFKSDWRSFGLWDYCLWACIQVIQTWTLNQTNKNFCKFITVWILGLP